jgi:hypothetical protein
MGARASRWQSLGIDGKASRAYRKAARPAPKHDIIMDGQGKPSASGQARGDAETDASRDFDPAFWNLNSILGLRISTNFGDNRQIYPWDRCFQYSGSRRRRMTARMKMPDGSTA